MPALLFLCTLSASLAADTDWPALVQKPHAQLPIPDLGLRPLLVTADGRKITTRDEWARQRQLLHDAWMARLGQPPEKPDRLDVKIEKTEKLAGHTRQLLSFLSEGDDRIRAWLLIPDDLKEKEKRPAVVVFHPTTRDTLHEPVGLGKDPSRAQGLHLVQRGWIVLCPECHILKDPKGWARGQAEALARRRPGWTGMGKMTFDASRCLDFLETAPNVDRTRFACIGFSLGAKEVLYAMAFEPRYQVGVFNEGGIGLRMSNWTDAWYLTEKMKPHIPALEHHQVLALVAPRPFLILGGIVPDQPPAPGAVDGNVSWPFVKAALPVYELLGAGDRVGLFNHKGNHGFPAEGRRIAYRWLEDWLRFTPTRE